MDSSKNKGLNRQTLGSGLMVAGFGLIIGFFVIKSLQTADSDAGLSAFEAARASMGNTTEAVQLTMPGDSPTAGQKTHSGSWSSPPDVSEWSEKRIREYQSSLEIPADAPHAVLNIDHLNIRVPVFNGADDFNLNRGVARIIGTGQVGEGSNLGIAGHRDGFFRPLKDIQIGDTFELETYFGTEVYRVSSIDIVDPSELDVLAPTESAMVTLVTCYPFYFVGNAPQRFIVKGEVLDHQVNS